MEDLLILIGLYILFIIIVFYCGCVVRRTKPKNNVHFYVARNMDGELQLYLGKPIRFRHFFADGYGTTLTSSYQFQKYGLDVRDFNNLKWEDEPVEVFLNIKD